MKRNAHMVDLLRPDLTYQQQKDQLTQKKELTEEDLIQIADKADALRLAAECVRIERYGK